MTDLTRENNNFQKKSICVMAAPVNEGTENGEIVAANDDHLLALLPPDSLILKAYIWVLTASDAATSATGTLGTTEGGSELLTGADLTTVGQQGTFVPNVSTGTGAEVWLGLTYVGAATNVGKYVACVEYLEYTLNTGNLTRFN